MTDVEIFSYVYAQIGSEKDTGIIRPVVIAMAGLVYEDLARWLLDNNSEMAKKLVVTLSNQTWTASSFAAPTNMLFYKQKETTRIDFGGTLAFQLEDRDKMEMAYGLTNHYYALE